MVIVIIRFISIVVISIICLSTINVILFQIDQMSLPSEASSLWRVLRPPWVVRRWVARWSWIAMSTPRLGAVAGDGEKKTTEDRGCFLRQHRRCVCGVYRPPVRPMDLLGRCVSMSFCYRCVCVCVSIQGGDFFQSYCCSSAWGSTPETKWLHSIPPIYKW